jgi:uncharacterized protein (TIGR03382 family)
VPDPTSSRRAVPAVLLVAALACAQHASAAQVWTTIATEKIRPSTSARTDTSAHISAAQNEFEAFQVVVTGAASNVRAVSSDLVGAGGTISGVHLYREAIMDLANASALDGGTGPWPDALVPDVDEVVGQKRNAFPFSVPANESRAIWVEVLVPPDAKPGDYAGQVQVTWDGGAATVPVTLTVWPFRLPSTSSLKSIFLFTYGAIPAEHGTSGMSFYTLRQRYGALALDHRITLANHDDGAWSDLSHFDTWYAPLMDGTGPTQLQGAENTSLQFLGSSSDSSWMSSWMSWGKNHGWQDRQYQYTCDEPPNGTCGWSQIPSTASTARNLGLRTLVTTTVQQADAANVTSSIDLMVPVINYLDDRAGNSSFTGNQRAKYDAFLAANPRREVWAYQSCMSHGCGGSVDFGNPSADDRYYTGWPSYMIDASAIRNRAMEWLSFRYRLSGELYYETAYMFGQNPWSTQWAFSGNGDGTLFYPGKPSVIGGATDIPVASIRLKMIREGMEDYEYLKLLSDSGDEALARQIADGLFPNAYSTEQSPAALMAARERIAKRIIELTGGATGGSSVTGNGGVGSGDPGTTGAPAEGTPATGTPATGTPATGTPATGTPATGTPAMGTPATGTPATGAPATGAPASASAISVPVRGGCGAGGAASVFALVGLAGAVRLRRRRDR